MYLIYLAVFVTLSIYSKIIHAMSVQLLAVSNITMQSVSSVFTCLLTAWQAVDTLQSTKYVAIQKPVKLFPVRNVNCLLISSAELISDV